MFRTGARRGRVGGRLEVAGGLGRSSRSRDGADAASSIGRPFGASRVGGGTPRARARIIASIAAPDDPSAAAGVPRTPPSRPLGVGGATPSVVSPGRSSTSFAIALVSAAPLSLSGRGRARRRRDRVGCRDEELPRRARRHRRRPEPPRASCERAYTCSVEDPRRRLEARREYGLAVPRRIGASRP